MSPYTLQSIIDETQSRNLKAGTEAETMKALCLLASFLALLSFCSYVIQAHLPRNSAAHSGLGTPASVSNPSKNASQTGPQASLMEATSHLRFPLSMHI